MRGAAIRIALATAVVAIGFWPAAGPARAETVTVHWNLKAYRTDNLPGLTENLNSLASRGFVPAAISLTGRDLWVLTIKNCPFYTSGDWSLERLDDLAAGIRQRLTAQSIPVGLALDEKLKYWVIFARMPTVEVLAWKIDTAAATRDTLGASLTRHLKAGFVPMGLDRRQKQVTIVYLKIKGWNYKSWKLDSAGQNVLETGINNHLSQGWIPVGLIFGRPTLVLYIK
jgi:hypothetical protein